MEDGVEAGDAQHETEALVSELQHADGPVAVAAGQGELQELALRDLDRVEPGDVGAAVLAQAADARAHDAGQDQQARPAPHAGGAARQAGQFLFGLQVRGHRGILLKGTVTFSACCSICALFLIEKVTVPFSKCGRPL